MKILKFGGGGILLLLLIFYFMGGSLFSFSNEYDVLNKNQYLDLVKQYNPQVLGTWDSMLNNLEKALRQDRIALFKADTLRTFIFVGLTLALLFLYQLKKIKHSVIVVLGIGLLALIDGWQIDKRYLNESNYIDKMFVDNPFPTQASPKLLNGARENYNLAGIAQKVPFNKTLDSLRSADKTQYRIFDNVFGTFNDATTSFFAHSVGGYHGAKLQNYQDIIDVYFSGSEQAKKHGASQADLESILNILNAKYFIHGNPSSPMVQLNKNAFGNSWLVSDIHWAENPNAEILALKDVDLKKTAVLNTKDQTLLPKNLSSDPNSSIQLTEYSPTKLTYSVQVESPKLAVFSEIYYPHGWTIKVDGEERALLKTNYFLRSVALKKGDKQVIMEFKPSIIKTGNVLTLSFNVIFVLLVLGGGYYLWKNKNKNVTEEN